MSTFGVTSKPTFVVTATTTAIATATARATTNTKTRTPSWPYGDILGHLGIIFWSSGYHFMVIWVLS